MCINLLFDTHLIGNSAHILALHGHISYFTTVDTYQNKLWLEEVKKQTFYSDNLDLSHRSNAELKIELCKEKICEGFVLGVRCLLILIN